VVGAAVGSGVGGVVDVTVGSGDGGVVGVTVGSGDGVMTTTAAGSVAAVCIWPEEATIITGKSAAGLAACVCTAVTAATPCAATLWPVRRGAAKLNQSRLPNTRPARLIKAILADRFCNRDKFCKRTDNLSA